MTGISDGVPMLLTPDMDDAARPGGGHRFLVAAEGQRFDPGFVPFEGALTATGFDIVQLQEDGVGQQQ